MPIPHKGRDRNPSRRPQGPQKNTRQNGRAPWHHDRQHESDTSGCHSCAGPFATTAAANKVRKRTRPLKTRPCPTISEHNLVGLYALAHELMRPRVKSRVEVSELSPAKPTTHPSCPSSWEMGTGCIRRGGLHLEEKGSVRSQVRNWSCAHRHQCYGLQCCCQMQGVHAVLGGTRHHGAPCMTCSKCEWRPES